MISSIFNWLEHRAGVKSLMRTMLLEGVPGGAKWRYVWGSCLAFVFSIQLITGILLMTAYSPSSSQAWNSVHFIQYKMDFGWLIRGLHHFGSQTMVVLIALHMLQVVIAGAHLSPRELNWWTGIGLLSMTLGLSLTGYLLPWDQKGYWATRVATNISSNIPIFGNDIKQLAVGGPDYGNHTLTRFYALHVAILPLSLIGLLVAHIVIFRRHGVTSAENVEGLVNNPKNEHGAEPFWPRQAFYDMLACMVVFGIMVGLVLYGFAHEVKAPPREDGAEMGLYEEWAKAGQRGKGAELDAAADRNTANYPARPEWYFLFLFQLLKYFPGDQILIGTVFIPNGVMMLLTMLPLFGYGSMRKIGHFFGVLVIMTLFILVGMLTLFALRDDKPEGILWGMVKNHDEKAIEEAKKHQHSVHEAEIKAKRSCQLAMDGTPVEGGHVLLRHDPFTTGQQLFQQKCGSCHSFTKHGDDTFDDWIPKDKDKKNAPTASDLGDFGSKAWVRGLLKSPMDDTFFGLVKKDAKDENGKPIKLNALVGMRNWRTGIDKVRKKWAEKEIADQEEDFDTIAAWLDNQRKPKDHPDPKQRPDEALAKRGKAAFAKDVNRCATCHSIEPDKRGLISPGGDGGPDLTNYATAEWIRGMIMRPGHGSRHGEHNRMPTFRNMEGPGAELALQEFLQTNPDAKITDIQHLADIDRELIIRWMLRDYRPIYGGTPIAK